MKHIMPDERDHNSLPSGVSEKNNEKKIQMPPCIVKA